MPFRCRRCHAYSHSAVDCSLGVHTLNGHGKHRGSKGHGSKSGGPTSSSPGSSMLQESFEVVVSELVEAILTSLPVIQVNNLVGSTVHGGSPLGTSFSPFLHP